MDYFVKTNKSLELKDEIFNYLKEKYETYPNFFRNPESEIMKPVLEKLYEEILISYKHAVFSIENNTIKIFSDSVFEEVYNQEQFKKAIELVDGTIIDENGEDLKINQNLFNMNIENERKDNPYLLYSNVASSQICYLNQFFYLVNKNALKKCITIQNWFEKLRNKNKEHVIRMDLYIHGNLMTNFFTTFCPTLFVLFGETFYNNDVPVLFTIPNLFNNEKQLPLNDYNFIQNFVPDKYLLINDLILIYNQYDLKNILNNQNENYYINGTNLFELYFLKTKQNINNKKVDKQYIKNYQSSKSYYFFNGDDRYLFEVMTPQQLQFEKRMNMNLGG